MWLLVLGLTITNAQVGGNFVNDYQVPGSESSRGLAKLRSSFPSASGYSGQIVFHADKGKVDAQKPAVASTMKNVGGLDHVVTATDPLTASGTPAVSKDGTIAYGGVSWDVVPASLDTGYLDPLDKAVEPARSAGLTVEYGGGAGQIGQAPDDALSETIGLACAFLLLLIMVGSFVAALVPLVGAVFSVGAGLALEPLVETPGPHPERDPSDAPYRRRDRSLRCRMARSRRSPSASAETCAHLETRFPQFDRQG